MDTRASRVAAALLDPPPRGKEAGLESRGLHQELNYSQIPAFAGMTGLGEINENPWTLG